jgi:hypothetical protein
MVESVVFIENNLIIVFMNFFLLNAFFILKYVFFNFLIED